MQMDFSVGSYYGGSACWLFVYVHRPGHIAPQDSLLLFNLALVQRWSASSVLKHERSSLSEVLSAVQRTGNGSAVCRYMYELWNSPI